MEVCFFLLEREGLFTCLASGVLNTWTVVLPKAILGLHGSCVLVPCHFTIPEQRTQDLLNCSNRNAWWVRFLGGPAVAPSQVPNP